jgi:hypothetical protein
MSTAGATDGYNYIKYIVYQYTYIKLLELRISLEGSAIKWFIITVWMNHALHVWDTLHYRAFFLAHCFIALSIFNPNKQGIRRSLLYTAHVVFINFIFQMFES